MQQAVESQAQVPLAQSAVADREAVMAPVTVLEIDRLIRD